MSRLPNSKAARLPFRCCNPGRLDVALSNTVSTLQAIGQGLDAIVLAPGAVVRMAPPDTTTALLVLKGKISSIKDLEGKRVGVNVINSSAWLHCVAALDKHGVDWTKVRFTEIPFPQMNDPLLNGQVDGITQVDPFRSALMATDKAEIVSWTYVETAPGTDITQYITLGPWAQKTRKPRRKFARAVMKARSSPTPTKPSRAISIRPDRPPTRPSRTRCCCRSSARAVNVAGMARTMELMQKFGLLKAPIDISSRVMKVP